MLVQVKGVVKGNTVVVEDKDILDYDGEEVIVTFLDYKERKTKHKPAIDWDSFRMPSERGGHVEEYMEEMRENDRI